MLTANRIVRLQTDLVVRATSWEGLLNTNPLARTRELGHEDRALRDEDTVFAEYLSGRRR